MKTFCLFVLSTICLCLAGCGERSQTGTAASVPKDSYRLTVSTIFSDEDEAIVLFTVEGSDALRYSVEPAGVSASTASLKDKNVQQGQVWLVASRISVREATLAKIVLRAGQEDFISTTTRKAKIPEKTKFKDVIRIDVPEGVHILKLDSPLLIARLDGGDLKLNVTKAGK